jgi:hypothetical protein
VKKAVLVVLVFLLGLVSGNAYESCHLSHQSMLLIAKVEKHPDRKLGYPYIISFNNKKDVVKAHRIFSPFFIKQKGIGRSIDCQDEETCVSMLNRLLEMHIVNMDLGSFQINYKFHRLNSKNDYFRVAESYEYACAYAQTFVDKYGPTFKALAMYHNKKPKYRNIYAKRMYDEYQKSK